MKIKVSKSELQNKLKMAAKLVGPHKTLPVLENFVIYYAGYGNLYVKGSDGAGEIVCAVDTLEIEGASKSVLVDKTLLNALAEMAEQPIEINIDDTFRIEVNYNGGHFELQGWSAEDYPKLSGSGEEIKLTLSKKTLLDGFKTCINFTAADELRPVMNGVYINATETGVDFVATDAHSLGLRQYDGVFTPFTAIVPTKAVKIISDILSKDKNDAEIDLYVNEKNVIIEYGQYSFAYRLIEGRYPNYMAVIPNGETTKLTIECADLLASIRRVSVFANSDSKLLKLSMNESGVVDLKSQDIDYKTSANETIFAEVKGEDLEIGTNSMKLLEVISAVDTDKCDIHFNGPSKAFIVHPDGDRSVTLLLMPMLLN